MNKLWQYRPLQPGEETKVYELIARVFQEFIAPHFSKEGCQEFIKYIQPEDLLRRSLMNYFVILALDSEEIIGMTEVRDYNHVSLLFVDGRHQGNGIGKALLDHAMQICKIKQPSLKEISVNASPNSILIYQNMGFKLSGYERVKNGVRYTPMVLELKVKPS